MKAVLKICGMRNKSCGVLLSNVISEIKGVESAEVDFKTCMAVILYSEDSVLKEVTQAIKKQGYAVI